MPKNYTSSSSGTLRLANEAFRNGDYDRCRDLYLQTLRALPALRSIIEANLRELPNYNVDTIDADLAKLDEVFTNTKIMEVATTASESTSAPHNALTSNAKLDRNTTRMAVVFHVYHADVLEEILQRLRLIPSHFDLYITSPHPRHSSIANTVLNTFPDAVYNHFENRGRDILPFIKIYKSLLDYDICLKLHTKRGTTNFGDLWRSTILDSILGSDSQIDSIIQVFQTDPKVMLAGPRDFYASGKKMLYRNQDSLKNVCARLGISYQTNKEWAFFAGTMFWFRPSLYLPYYSQLLELEFAPESGKQDGALEHSIERLFGLIPSYAHSKVLLSSPTEDNGTPLIVQGAEGAVSEEPTARLALLAKSRLRSMHIQGDLNPQPSGRQQELMVQGWLAMLGTPEPREYSIRVGNIEICGAAELFRPDLEKNRINRGYHAFTARLPPVLADGQEHSVTLFDRVTNLPVATRTYLWPARTRPYHDFDGYLASAYTAPYVSVPFTESDKRAFAAMEVIANAMAAMILTERPLVSIVMPSFNREKQLPAAIDSIRKQSYSNWELIVVDDNSDDGTAALLAQIADSRISAIHNPENLGVSKSRNIGLMRARGEIIAYLDSDNTWDDRYLSVVVAALYHYTKHVDAVYCGQIVYRGKEQTLDGVRYGPYNKSLLWNNNYIDLNCFAHRREIIHSNLLFDESLRRCVDWDFICRISASFRIASIPVLLSNYFLELADNSITGNKSLERDIETVRANNAKLRDTYWSLVESKAGAINKALTVIIPSFEALSDLQQCIASLLAIAQSTTLVQICIVDNASGQDVRTFLNELQDKHPDIVRIIQLDRNFGFSYAVNIGLKAVDLDRDILLLNNDAIVSLASIGKLQRTLHSSDAYGVAIPAQILRANTPTITDHVPYATDSADLDVNISAVHKNVLKMPLFYDGEPFTIEFAPFFSALIKSSTRQMLPYLDEANGRHYRSDRTYCNVLRTLFGLSIVYVPDAWMYHGLQKSTRELKDKNPQSSGQYRDIMINNQWSPEEVELMNIRVGAWC